MSLDYQLLPHAGIRSLHPYVPGKPIEELKRESGISDIIKLASNENPFGCSPLVVEALANMSLTDIASYPAPHLHPLIHALSEKNSISADRITLSNGSDFIFTLALELFALGTNKHMLTHDKAFMTFAIQAQTLNIPVVSTPLLENWQVDIEAMISACNENTGLIFLANPNNPTGVLLPGEKLIQLLNSIPESCIVVLDEAYFEFAYKEGNFNNMELLNDYPNLIITRTFSKAYGLAGLRLGYAFASKEITELLQRIQLPFTVNQAAMTAGLAALQDQAFLANTIEQNQLGLGLIRRGLENLNLDTLPSECNFITFDCKTNSLPIYQALLEHGIIVRPLTPYQMTNYLRVTIGKHNDNIRFLNALKKIISKE